MKPRSPLKERQLHGYTADLLRLFAVPNLIWFHPANEGLRAPRTGAFLKRMGMLKGVADFVIITPGGKAHFLELKKEGAYQTADQRAFQASCTANGASYAVARSPEDVRDILREWGAVNADRNNTITRRAA